MPYQVVESLLQAAEQLQVRSWLQAVLQYSQHQAVMSCQEQEELEAQLSHREAQLGAQLSRLVAQLEAQLSRQVAQLEAQLSRQVAQLEALLSRLVAQLAVPLD